MEATLFEHIKEQLVRPVGLRLKPYRSTASKLTIGICLNLDVCIISRKKAYTMLERDILFNTDIQKILHWFYTEGKGRDPILHFYETFLSEYDPKLREKRGVYYTSEPVVRYILLSIHSLLKSHFGKVDGIDAEDVTILDSAARTLLRQALESLAVEVRTNRSLEQLPQNCD
jgi:hypothetical protein